eukprot:4951226-Pyramimonas_sp.AAC.1
MTPVASGCGNGQSVARGSRSCSIITTRKTLSAGVLSGSPSLLQRACLGVELTWPVRSSERRCFIPGCTLCRLQLPVSGLQAAGNLASIPPGVHLL